MAAADPAAVPATPTGPAAPGVIPADVRAAVLHLSAEVLGALEPTAVPAALAAVRRFAPRRRAEAGAGPLWSAIEQDAAFRSRVVRAWALAHPEAAAEVLDPHEGAVVGPHAADDRLTLAVGTVLLRPAGWSDRLGALLPARAGTTPVPAAPGRGAADAPSTEASDTSGATASEAAGGAGTGAAAPARTRRPTGVPADRGLPRSADPATVHRLTARLAAESDRADAAEAEAAALRKELRRLRSDADRARSEARRAAEHAAEVAEAAERVHAEAARVHAAADEDRRRADELVRTARADAAALRDLAQVRVRLLLDTLVEAGSALRDELALPPAGRLPADLVVPPAGSGPGAGLARGTSRGRSAEDPALLDDLLALPRPHLVVDGYNVSKLAWPDLPLIEQRRRLTERLANLAGRTGAEVTCCFDGQDGPTSTRAPAAPRGVRVLFARGEIADDLIRRLVRAEPRGRVVVAVTSDRALGADLEATGARVLPSATLIARLGRL
ncbi:MAG TPA: NYN domain-containing protein [Cellulomonas sp.]